MNRKRNKMKLSIEGYRDRARMVLWPGPHLPNARREVLPAVPSNASHSSEYCKSCRLLCFAFCCCRCCRTPSAATSTTSTAKRCGCCCVCPSTVAPRSLTSLPCCAARDHPHCSPGKHRAPPGAVGNSRGKAVTAAVMHCLPPDPSPLSSRSLLPSFACVSGRAWQRGWRWGSG